MFIALEKIPPKNRDPKREKLYKLANINRGMDDDEQLTLHQKNSSTEEKMLNEQAGDAEDISGYECAEQQERYTTRLNTALLNDNIGCDLNTAAGTDTNCNPVKPTESPVMNSDKCDGAVRVDLKCDKNIKSTINASTIDESPLVKLVKIQDNKQLSVHNRNHTGEKSSSCDVRKKAKIAAHRRSQTGEKTFLCTTCGKLFVHERTLSVHNRIHTGENTFTCSTCSKVFTTQCHLTEHIRTHTGERPFPCKRCDKSFTKQYNLTIHARIHTGEKPFLCTKCNKSFTTQSNLTIHARIHTGERPFPCTRCEKSFTQQSHLTRHTHIHTGEKPDSCEMCGQRFYQKAHVSSYIRTHTGGI